MSNLTVSYENDEGIMLILIGVSEIQFTPPSYERNITGMASLTFRSQENCIPINHLEQRVAEKVMEYVFRSLRNGSNMIHLNGIIEAMEEGGEDE